MTVLHRYISYIDVTGWYLKEYVYKKDNLTDFPNFAVTLPKLILL